MLFGVDFRVGVKKDDNELRDNYKVCGDNMLKEQKDWILEIVKKDYDKRDFNHSYLLSYKEFLDVDEMFTDFNCERSLGKQQYITLIEKITIKDKAAKVYVEIYGVEEEQDDVWVYADTIIIFTALSFQDIQELLNGSSDLFPSDIGEIEDITKDYKIIKNGQLYSATEIHTDLSNIYYCWWD